MAQDLPPSSLQYLPVLERKIQDFWPDLSLKSSLAGQVEQETCITLKHKKCWNPRAELKTSRENGIGLGQITIAYNKDGSVRFDNFQEMKKLSVNLSSWKWEDRYNADLQLEALVLFDRKGYLGIKFPTANETQRLAFSFSAYNGGLGGVLQDRKLCQSTPQCDPSSWYASPNYSLGVKDVSFKSKVKPPGYGQSFYEINREYVNNILLVRRLKYDFMDTNKSIDSISLKPIYSLSSEVRQ